MIADFGAAEPLIAFYHPGRIVIFIGTFKKLEKRVCHCERSEAISRF
jgi:phage terminase large subunit-like protein